MIILPEYNRPYLIENINSPIVPKNFWGFSSTLGDFKLYPLLYLEETTGTIATIDINGILFDIPYNWNIIITDDETLMIDCIAISECSIIQSKALIMTPADGKFRSIPIIIHDIKHNVSLSHPLIQRGCAMCQPIGEIELDDGTKTYGCIVISPYDFYKTLEGKSFFDII